MGSNWSSVAVVWMVKLEAAQPTHSLTLYHAFIATLEKLTELRTFYHHGHKCDEKMRYCCNFCTKYLITYNVTFLIKSLVSPPCTPQIIITCFGFLLGQNLKNFNIL